MSDTSDKRQYGLWLVLALTVTATLWTALTEDDAATNLVVEPRPTVGPRAAKPHVGDTHGLSQRAMRVADSTPSSTVLDLGPLQRPRMGIAPGELFDTELPPSQQTELAAAAAPLQPTVPPLPYTYAGKLIDGDRYIVFLTAGDKNYSVRVGDTLGDWRVKAIRPPQMILSYVPMQAEVPLKIGEAN